jgi:hypothetical protein
MNKEFFDFSIRATRMPPPNRHKWRITMYHTKRPNVSTEVDCKPRIDAERIPDILCNLMREYERKFDEDSRTNPL